MRLVSIPSVLVLTLFSTATVFAQDQSLEPVVDAASTINQSAKSSQLKVEDIADSIQERIQQYKQISRQIDGLNVYTQQLQKQLDSQDIEKAELNSSN
ncbi:hypothetical protein C9988_04140 [Pseudidiomarina aestuarii]|nr:hypothetical protein C9988_04140 [Pseudidiomarina aestuarii]